MFLRREVAGDGGLSGVDPKLGGGRGAVVVTGVLSGLQVVARPGSEADLLRVSWASLRVRSHA